MILSLSKAKHSKASSELKMLTRNQKLQIANGIEKRDIILSQVDAAQNSRQVKRNIHNSFKPLASIIIERFDNPINLIFISEKRLKKSVKKRQHKIKQINNWRTFKEIIKVEDKHKRYSRVESLHSLSYSVKEIHKIYK